MTLSDMSEGSSLTSVLTAGGVTVEDDAADVVVVVLLIGVCGGGVAAGGGISSTMAVGVGVDVAVVVEESGVVGLTSPVMETVAVAARLNFFSFPPLACFHSFKILLSKSTTELLMLLTLPAVEVLPPGTVQTLSLQSASTGVLLNPKNVAVYILVAMVVCIMSSNATTQTRRTTKDMGTMFVSFFDRYFVVVNRLFQYIKITPKND